MKRILLLLLLTLPSFACEQDPDFLHLGKEKYYLRYCFPLQRLKLKYRPFKRQTSRDAPHTGCHRGYQAVWKVENDSLFLVKIKDCDFGKGWRRENIRKLFEKNGLTPTYKGRMIFADWFSDELYLLDDRYLLPEEFLDGRAHYRRRCRYFTTIKNGIVTTLNLSK